jgi:Lrp/AsnC family transcriptional regulator, leucine-responsive regulatory protein
MAFDSGNNLDSTGWHILRVLQENARISYTELGRLVGLSAPAVAERVRKLEEAGVISGYHATVNPAKVGYPVLAIIRIGSTGASFNKCAEAVKAMHEVLECHRITGSDSFYLKIMVPSIMYLETLIDQLQPFGETTTTLVLSSAVTRRTIAHGPIDVNDESAGVRPAGPR